MRMVSFGKPTPVTRTPSERGRRHQGVSPFYKLQGMDDSTNLGLDRKEDNMFISICKTMIDQNLNIYIYIYVYSNRSKIDFSEHVQTQVGGSPRWSITGITWHLWRQGLDEICGATWTNHVVCTRVLLSGLPQKYTPTGSMKWVRLWISHTVYKSTWVLWILGGPFGWFEKSFLFWEFSCLRRSW